MEQYIPKSALVAEIERRMEKYATIDVGDSRELDALYGAKCKALMEILSFLDATEVKEVDLEKEIENWWNDRYKKLNKDYEFFGKYNGHYMENSTVISLVKHFYELGLNARKEN